MVALKFFFERHTAILIPIPFTFSCHLRQNLGLGDLPRIRAQNAIHVCPDLHGGRFQELTEDAGGVVATVPVFAFVESCGAEGWNKGLEYWYNPRTAHPVVTERVFPKLVDKYSATATNRFIDPS